MVLWGTKNDSSMKNLLSTVIFKYLYLLCIYIFFSLSRHYSIFIYEFAHLSVVPHMLQINIPLFHVLS